MTSGNEQRDRCQCHGSYQCASHRHEELTEVFHECIGIPTMHDARLLAWLADFDSEVCEWVRSLMMRSRGPIETDRRCPICGRSEPHTHGGSDGHGARRS